MSITQITTRAISTSYTTLQSPTRSRYPALPVRRRTFGFSANGSSASLRNLSLILSATVLGAWISALAATLEYVISYGMRRLANG